MQDYHSFTNDFVHSADPDVVSLAIKRIKLVLALDRYCWDAMFDTLSTSSSTANLFTNASSLLPASAAQKPNLNGKMRDADIFNWFYRHRTTEGRIHARKVHKSPPS
jgi:hypothetical protein